MPSPADSTAQSGARSTLAREADKVIVELHSLAEDLRITPRERFDGELLAERVVRVANLLLRPEHWGQDPEDVIGAIRLALLGGSDDRARVALTEALVGTAPTTPLDNVGAPRLLVRELQKLRGHFEVSS